MWEARAKYCFVHSGVIIDYREERLTTLENPLLYSNFLKVLERNHPDIEVDSDDID